MLTITSLNKAAPDFRVGFIFMLFSMIVILCVSKTEAAIVDGDFEASADFSGPIPTATMPAWSPTSSTYTLVQGTDPNYYNSDFHSLISAGGGTPGGSISATFATSPVSNQISMGSISQNVSTTPGHYYDIRLWVANIPTTVGGLPDPSARENLFSVMWNGTLIDLSAVDPVHFATPNPSNPNAVELPGPAGTYVLAATGNWTLVVISSQAASAGATTNLTISAQNNNNATAVDAVDLVDVTPTPEPSSVVLLAAGTALVGLRRRRERKAA